MHDPQGQGCVRFGPFVLDLESGLLRNGSTEVRLSDQPLALLIALLERPGTLVTREDLHGRLWPDGTFVDFEHGLKRRAGNVPTHPRHRRTSTADLALS